MSLRLMCLCLALGVSCRRTAVEPTPTTGTPAPTSVAGSSVPSAPPAVAVTPTAGVANEKAKVEEELQSEERETNPTSETVTLTLNISPPVKALVMWGAKQLARVAPDKPTVELQRPRSSGPLDLEIRAEGFLPHHTRLHSDRNDKVNVRLVRPAEASTLHGFRSSTSAAAAKAKTK
jgi:hypothetical protein